MPEAVIVDAVRTPIGRAFKGSLTQMRPDDLGAHVVNELLTRNPDVKPESIEEVACGVGLPQGKQAFNLARIVVLLSELPDGVNGVTLSRYCASGLDAIRYAANAVKAGQGDAYIAAGVEIVSQYNERQEAAGEADQHPRLRGENGDVNAYISMGLTAENVAKRYEVSRAEQDEYAQRSQELAVASQEDGFFDREIVAVELPDGTKVERDDGPRAGSSLEKLAELQPAFDPEGGTVTAGNSCPLNDGAAASLIMSEDRASELGLKPRARIVTAATAGLEPEFMGVAPIGAVKKVLDRAGMRIEDVDVVELNEAFAAQVIPIMNECGIPLENLNPHGGAIALGHPFGMTGVRIMT
ncbi:MAG: acetyl-CoA C-acyltransferase, partial [Thermoleophilaceae bacterium]|nr:acetyl-CoA C-acyltransferase [Thermoleophilaceae bacterium]